MARVTLNTVTRGRAVYVMRFTQRERPYVTSAFMRRVAIRARDRLRATVPVLSGRLRRSLRVTANRRGRTVTVRAVFYMEYANRHHGFLERAVRPIQRYATGVLAAAARAAA